jgi:putative oxidoreductase
MNPYLFLAGRVLYALPLLLMGANHFLLMAAMVNYAKLKGVPLPELSVIFSGLILVLGAVSILLGFRVKIGAWLVLIFLFGSAIFMHRYWDITDVFDRQMETANFLKNVIMAGAAIVFSQIGGGPFSLDNRGKATA